MQYKLRHVVLLSIVLLAYVLRVYHVSVIPPSLSWDEASIGYNAYSILKTGYDEHHKKFPIDTFVAFGDYKPPLAIYLTVPSVLLFGLNEFAVRFPSVIAGTLTVLFTYFLIMELFKSSLLTTYYSLLASLLLAISPWHIQLSRAGFEANFATMFIVLGVWLLVSADRYPKRYRIAFLPFVAAMYTFNSARYFAPLLVGGIVLFHWSYVRKQATFVGIGIIIAFVSLLPLVPHLVSSQARLRFEEVNIFTDASVVKTANDRIHADQGAWWSKVLHNRRIGFARSYLMHFLDNLEPGFLFIRGDGNPKFSIQDVGQLYIVELPFLILGIYYMFAKHTSLAWLLVYWIIAAIIPAATARETPHALRIENSLPVWQVFAAFGLLSTINYQLSKIKRIILAIIVGCIYVGSFSYYWHNYYTHYAKEYSGEWQYGYREAIGKIQLLKNSYTSIVMTDSIGRPYIYALFYEKTDPDVFWRTADTSFDAAGFFHVYGFEKYRFIRGGVQEFSKKTLYILDPAFVPGTARIIETIPLLNGAPRLVLFDI